MATATDNAILELENVAKKIVESAQLLQSTDQDSAEGISRTVSALDDLGR
jgi:hypothetical protein